MSEDPAPRILDAGDSCLVVEFGITVDRALNAKVQSLKAALARSPQKGLVELVPTYRSLAVYYDPRVLRREDLKTRIEHLSENLDASGSEAGRVVSIPVFYGGEFGPDLENVCAHTGLPAEEVIARYTGRDTYCFMLGFTPGFAYLGGMDETLATPRLENPRIVIRAGSVWIAG
jgi:Allophanate hydrolase subunit 1